MGHAEKSGLYTAGTGNWTVSRDRSYGNVYQIISQFSYQRLRKGFLSFTQYITLTTYCGPITNSKPDSFAINHIQTSLWQNV